MLIVGDRHFADAARAPEPPTRKVTAGPRGVIPHGQTLFAPSNERRSAYRVESGALCHSIVWPDGTHEVIEFAFPGDILGLGALAEHVSTAHALVDTIVTELSSDELEQALKTSDALANRLSAAMDREFEFLRARALQPGRRPVLNRVAAYLVAVARSACRTGETPVAAGDEGVAAIAAMLDIGAGDVRSALQKLSAHSLIAERDDALVILDRDGLERFAEA